MNFIKTNILSEFGISIQNQTAGSFLIVLACQIFSVTYVLYQWQLTKMCHN